MEQRKEVVPNQSLLAGIIKNLKRNQNKTTLKGISKIREKSLQKALI
jgi:hypothetical protein